MKAKQNIHQVIINEVEEYGRLVFKCNGNVIAWCNLKPNENGYYHGWSYGLNGNRYSRCECLSDSISYIKDYIQQLYYQLGFDIIFNKLNHERL